MSIRRVIKINTSQLFYCSMGDAIVELCFDTRGIPICFDPVTGVGNTCSEPEYTWTELSECEANIWLNRRDRE